MIEVTIKYFQHLTKIMDSHTGNVENKEWMNSK